MSVEIGELTVNARVVSDTQSNSSNNQLAESDGDKHQLVERCISEVLRILEEKRER